MSKNGTLRGRDIFSKYKTILNFLSQIASKLPNTLQLFLLRFFQNFNGKLGLGIRYIIIKALAKECGENVSIHPGVYLFNPDKLKIGNNVSIHPMCYIDATGQIEIGDDVSIAHGSSILSTEHLFSSHELPIKDQGIIFKKTIIDSNVWISSGTRILAGTYINKGSIIAAGAVIKGKVKKDSIYGGVPAKFIKER